MEHLVHLLEKIVILSAQAVEEEIKGTSNNQPKWMEGLTKAAEIRPRLPRYHLLGRKRRHSFYPNPQPEVGQVVWAKIVGVTDTQGTAHLLEYGRREGTIPNTEATRRRVRSMGRVFKVGKNEAVQVVRIDAAKGYIDLSKKQVTPTEAKNCEIKYKRGNEVRSVLCHVADTCELPATEVMEQIAYPLYEKEAGKDAFEWLYLINQLNQDGKTDEMEKILGPLNLSEKLTTTLLDVLKNAMRRKVVTILAEVELECYECDGVEVIREVLKSARRFAEKESPDIPVSFSIIGPPRYGLRARTDMKEEALLLFAKVIEKMKIEVAQKKGLMSVKVPPQITGDDGDKQGDENDKQDDDQDEDDD
ncbi:translation initiation factor 2 subunit 1 [Angomonas deanei]|nr:translation initiation factor 2 subunit 1 [Angomonas deanei]|eukprot:EPY33984.1 translation initiation factor 2 subunit 1 [Angomonas deanei]